MAKEFYGWKNGLPTKPDVDLLMKTYTDLSEGDRIPYEDIEKVIDVDRATRGDRFKTVTDSWRKRMLEKGLVIECQKDVGFYVAAADDVISNTYGTFSFVIRKSKKQRRKLLTVRKHTEEQSAIIAHQGRLLYETESSAKKSRMNILPSTSHVGLPDKENRH